MNKFIFKKKFGQNFLKDENIISKIVNGANIDKDTLVVEVGPGCGALSKRIIPLSGYSLLYEIDTSLKDSLIENLPFDNYKLIFEDFLKVNLVKDIGVFNFKKFYLVANLPYYITTPIISKFIDDGVYPDKMVIMVQKEVADRLVAKCGSKDYGSLTVFLKYFYNISKLCDVSRHCFIPEPNVDSTVIVLDLVKKRKEIKDICLFKCLVRDSFQFKRKNIRNNLRDYDLELVDSVLEKYGYDLSVRAELLDLDIFIDISNALFCSKD